MSEAVKQYQPAIRQHQSGSKGWRWWRWCCFPREIEKVPPNKFGRWLQQTKKKLTRKNSLLHPLSFCLLFLFLAFLCTHHHTAHKHPNTQTQSRHKLAQATKAAAAIVPLLSFNYRPTSTTAGTAAAAATLAIECTRQSNLKRKRAQRTGSTQPTNNQQLTRQTNAQSIAAAGYVLLLLKCSSSSEHKHSRVVIEKSKRKAKERDCNWASK